jgi:Domain of unknown function (DUF3560)
VADIVIRHTRAEGTLIEGSRRGDGVWEILKGLHGNWRSFRSLGMLGIGQSRDKDADTWKIDAAAKALREAGHTVEIEIDNGIARSFAEAEQERVDRAEDRADRRTTQAANAAARSEAAHERASQLARRFEGGQPILVGHHSERGARNAQRKMWAADRRSADEAAKSRRLAQLAEGAAGYQASRTYLPTTLRRIDKLEAEKRGIVRDIEGGTRGKHPYIREVAPATGDWLDKLQRRLAYCQEQIDYWQVVVEGAKAAGAKVWTRADFQRGDLVKSRGHWYEVERVNPKSVSVPHGNNDHLLPVVTRALVTHAMGPSQWTGTIPYDDVQGRKPAVEAAEIMAEVARREAAGKES